MQQDQNKKDSGLSSSNRNFIVVFVAILLLIFGPIEPYGMFIRTLYLIAIPTLLWLSLWYWGNNWRMDELSNDRLARALAAGIAGVLLVGAYFSYTAKYHFECDQYSQTRDGQECIGDYVREKGGDMGNTLIQIIFAGFAVWFALAKNPENDRRY